MSLTQNLVRLIRTKEITQADLDAAAYFTLDAIANALAGRNTEPGRKMLALQGQLGGTSDAGRQALVLGALTHILEVDDLHRASVVHPGCVVVPAVSALSQKHGFSGREFLTAVIHGFEATCRIGMAVGQQHYRVWHSTATCGPFGSAMASACLLGLDEDATVDALGNAGTQSAGLWQFLETGAMSKHLHAGRAAEAGLVAAELAALGFTGPPEILEGSAGLFKAACPDADPARVLADPNMAWQIHQTSIKPWPSCRHTHPAIDAALELHSRISPDEIRKIEVTGYQAVLDVCNRPDPTSVYEAKFSLQHCVAVALSKGVVDFQSFEKDMRNSLERIRRKITLTAGEPFVSAYPTRWGSKMDIYLKSGEKVVAERSHCKGDPEDPVSLEELKVKSKMLMAFGKCKGSDGLMKGILDMAAGCDAVRFDITKA